MKFVVTMLILFIAMIFYGFVFDVTMFMIGFEVNQWYHLIKVFTAIGFVISFSNSLVKNETFVKYIKSDED